jgi:hypothetical protein
MIERSTDEELAERIAWLTGRDEGGRIPTAMGGLTATERGELSNLVELQQHRARIVAHESAHPERLPQSSIDEIAVCGDGAVLEDVVDGDEIGAMAIEIQQWRAADLTAADRDDAARDLLDALSLPSGRDVRAAWDRACMLFGRSGGVMLRAAFEQYLDELASSGSAP